MAAFFRSRFLSSLRIAYGDGTVTPVAFRVTANELKVLSSTQAVDALRDLLYAEAKLLGIPITGVNVPTAVNTRDKSNSLPSSSLLRSQMPLYGISPHRIMPARGHTHGFLVFEFRVQISEAGRHHGLPQRRDLAIG
jgi:hypothetical protein